MLYYSLSYSHLQYCINIEGEATKTCLHEIKVRQNNIIQTITYNPKFTDVTNCYKKFNLLKLNEIYTLEMAKFMHKSVNNELESTFHSNFLSLDKVHNHNIRQISKSICFWPRITKPVKNFKTWPY